MIWTCPNSRCCSELEDNGLDSLLYCPECDREIPNSELNE